MMFMAMTNILTSALGPIPLIWITPLGIYLITFILTFKKKCWCPSWIEKSMPILLVLSAYSFFDFESIFFPLYAKFFWLSLIIFVSCLFCHAQLVKTGLGFGYSLTKFYTILAFGGFIGGLTTTWIAPIISKSFIEYPIALTWIAIASLILTPPKNRIRAILLLLVPVCLLQVCLKDIQNKNPNILYQHRNYYGIYKVIQNNKLRLLIHQTTVHGAQIQAKQLELEPSSFYSRTSAIGEVFESNLFTPRKIAVVGLGAGTLSAYAEPDTHMDFYELDPEIYQIAKKYFTYLSKAQGTFQYIFGDARLSFKKNNDEKYDFLVLDAFGGSSIPTHLITKEAVRTYRNHLSNQGILFFHVSSTHARLESVLLDIASEFKGSILRKTTSGAPYGIPSVWIALTWSQSSFKKLAFNLKWSPVYSLEKKWRRVWTDDYSSILQIVDYRKFKKLFVMEKISKDFADAFIGNSYIDR